jgi:hypothetical protein
MMPQFLALTVVVLAANAYFFWLGQEHVLRSSGLRKHGGELIACAEQITELRRARVLNGAAQDAEEAARALRSYLERKQGS